MVPVDAEEYRRWFGQSAHTLQSATRDAEEADYGWACFKAQQAAEYAVKALLRAVGDPAVGRSLVKLTETLEARPGIPVPEELRQAARTLDRHYIPPRYPDAYPSGMPYEFYDQPTACEALESARRIAAFVRDQALALGIPPDHPSSHGTESSPPPGSGQTAEGTP
ncbi:HEPN domain-containing protein [Carboxydochorda subterranea]|uniref:HEPN domain-containing protein n=1 Tax=Carboxydichorda subterranea TaxID=3109565 RepID=A0ABZ1BUF6_9FIRM|nr:HEPN domain-containing protein [Limnochorda sp. L945t]WRP16319.1 HEPN domain-containing protein [Limnochorda sp. L945t]